MENTKYKTQNLKLRSRQIVGGLLTLTMIVPAGIVFARTQKNQLAFASVTVQSLGVEEPAILASNPFYGLSDLMRGMKDSFASGRIGKALAKLDNLNLKGAQFIKIRAVAPDNTKSIAKALGEYQLAVYQYAITAARLTTADFTGDGAEHISTFVSSSIVNLRLIDDVLAASQTTAEQAILAEIFERLAQSTVKLFAEDLGLVTVRLRISELSSSDPFIAMRNAEMLAALAKEATAVDQISAAQDFMALRVSLLDAVAATLAGSPAAKAPKLMSASLSLMPAGSDVPVTHLAPEQVDDFALLAGSAAERIQTLSYLLSTKEFSQDSDLVALRNQLLIKVFSR